MTTIAAVRDGMAEAIREGCGLRCIAYMLDKIPAPCAEIEHGQYDPRMVMDGRKGAHQFIVRLYFPRLAEKANTKKLDALRETSGPGSLRQAVEDSDNWPAELQTAVEYASVTSIGAVESRAVAEEVFLSCEFEIEVVFDGPAVV